MPRRRLLLLPVCTFVSALAVAQQDGRPPVVHGVEATLVLEITSRLRSDDPVTVAWGAHLAAKHRVAAAVPVLREQLAALTGERRPPHSFRAFAILDALVQTDAVLSANEITPFLDGPGRAAAFALLVRDPVGHREALRAHFRSLDDERGWLEWRATGEVLAGLRDAVLAVDLLERLEMEFEVVVRSPGDDSRRAVGARSGGRGFSGSERFEVPEGLPPTVLYTLSEFGDPGDVLLIAADKPIYLHRTVYEERRFRAARGDGSHLFGAHQKQRRAWLERMLGGDITGLPFGVKRLREVEWRDAESFAADVARLREEARTDYRRVVDLCVDRGLVTRDAVDELTPRIEWKRTDARLDRSEELPDLDAVVEALPPVPRDDRQNWK